MFFKLSNLKPIHSISFDLLRQLDTFSLFDFTLIIMENLLFAPMNLIEKKEKNKANPFPDFTDLNLNFINIKEPYLPSGLENSYILVLDMDETLIHYFFVF